MNLKRNTIIIFVLGMLTGIFIVAQMAFKEEAEKKETTQKLSTATVPRYTAPVLPTQMTLFGEKVPLERRDIREAFDRELIYNSFNQGHMIYLLKLSDRYFPIIEPILQKHGLPDDFKYLCVAESNLQNLISRVGATGFWQFMPGTAPGYSLELNSNVDERYDVVKSTEAACKYLKTAYNKFGNWTAAAASYNCGMGGYNAQANFQNTKYYYDLLLPEETNKYIFRILAFKQIMGNPEQYGYHLDDNDLYGQYPTRTVRVNNSISNLVSWAQSNGTNYKMVKKLNPWIRGKTLVAKPGKTYEIKLPAE